MKRIHFFLFCYIIAFLMVACQKEENTQELSQQELIIETEDATNNEATKTTQDQETTQAATIAQIPLKDETFAIEVDPNLVGIELIKAAKVVNPIDAISYEIDNVFGSGDMQYHIKRTVTKVGKNYKKVTTSEGAVGGDEGKVILIYHSGEKMTYQYYEASMTGYKYLDDLESGSGPAIEEEYELTTLYAEESNLVKAEVTEYREEPVMYFEIMEAGNTISSWVSLRYGITVKTEVYEGDQVISSSVVSNIQIPEGLDDAFFMPPNEVIFEDYSGGEGSIEDGEEGVQ